MVSRINSASKSLQEYHIRQGFGRGRIKEYFVAQADGDTLGGVVTGPFETEEQALTALDALKPLCNRALYVIGGHMVGSGLKGLIDR
jgi:hypothetical protein